jgi:tRNA dimethylallyltransferase
MRYSDGEVQVVSDSAKSTNNDRLGMSAPLLVLVGPTAVGKTSISLHLAEQFRGEIVSADSRLIYRGLDIGTDKPSPEELERIPHHLVNLCLPDQTISLGQYQRLAMDAIRTIHEKDMVPIVVGGTGQYVRAVVQGWKIPEVPPQLILREALDDLGQSEAARWLRALDSESAEKIEPRNRRRIIRALEVTLVKGVPMSKLRRSSPPGFDVLTIGLTCERRILYQRIDARIDRMIEKGLIDEVSALRNQGYGINLSAMSGLGYRQLLSYLDGEITLDAAVERIKFETHRFARQQYNWFRLDDRSINWIDVIEPRWQQQVSELAERWLFSHH